VVENPIAADIEIPHLARDVVEILRRVYPNADALTLGTCPGKALTLGPSPRGRGKVIKVLLPLGEGFRMRAFPLGEGFRMRAFPLGEGFRMRALPIRERAWRNFHAFYLATAGDGEIRDEVVGLAHEVMAREFPAEGGKLEEKRLVIHERHAREIDFQKFEVFLAVSRAVEDCVNIAEDLFGGRFRRIFPLDELDEGLFEIRALEALTVGACPGKALILGAYPGKALTLGPSPRGRGKVIKVLLPLGEGFRMRVFPLGEGFRMRV